MSDRIMVLKADDEAVQLAGTDEGAAKVVVVPPTQGVAVDGTTSSTPNEQTEIEFGVTSEGIYLHNTDVANAMSVSFDGGDSFFSLSAGDEISVDLVRTSVIIKSASASVPYLGLVTGD